MQDDELREASGGPAIGLPAISAVVRVMCMEDEGGQRNRTTLTVQSRRWRPSEVALPA